MTIDERLELFQMSQRLARIILDQAERGEGIDQHVATACGALRLAAGDEFCRVQAEFGILAATHFTTHNRG